MAARETAIQAVNRTIRDFADDPRVPRDEHWVFFCECGCFTLVSLSVAEFDEERAVWAGGHGDQALRRSRLTSSSPARAIQ